MYFKWDELSEKDLKAAYKLIATDTTGEIARFFYNLTFDRDDKTTLPLHKFEMLDKLDDLIIIKTLGGIDDDTQT